MYDSKKFFSPFFFNAMKYFTAMIVATISYCTKVYANSEGLFTAWIVFAAISMIYSFFWDLKYDWGFLEKGSKHKGLRNVLAYHHIHLYYIVIVANFFLRMSWIVSISPDIVAQMMRPELVTFIVAFLEVFRRCVWNFLRVEKEHIANCGSFKAVESLVLPYSHLEYNDTGKVILKNELDRLSEKVSQDNEKYVLIKGGHSRISSIASTNIPGSIGYSSKELDQEIALNEKIESNLVMNHDESSIMMSIPEICVEERIAYSKEHMENVRKTELPLQQWKSEVKEAKKEIKKRMIVFHITMQQNHNQQINVEEGPTSQEMMASSNNNIDLVITKEMNPPIGNDSPNLSPVQTVSL
jgi:hypothetical protein